MADTQLLPTAGLIVLKGNRLLLAFSNNKQAWYLPGGKLDAGETSEEALIREIKEELEIDVDLERLTPYCHISAPAYGEMPNVQMEQDCFLYDLDGDTVSANQEIGDVQYFSWEEYQQEPVQVPGVLMVYQHLNEDFF